MLIILTLYLVLIWLVFSKFKMLRWGWGSGAVTVLLGAFTIGRTMATGCIQLVEADVVDLYPRVSSGARVIMMN